jgi:hypothetical protein
MGLLMKLLFLMTLCLKLTTVNAQESIQTQIKTAKSQTQRLLTLQKKPLQKKDLYAGNPEKADYIISGVPKTVKQVNPKGVIYRHYVGKNMEIVLKTSQLKTGITPYVIMNPGFSREVYEDLAGMFLTTPQTPPEKVGLPRDPNYNYIDFTLYSGTPVLEIEPEILLIPGIPDVPEWLKKLYIDYKNTGRYDRHYLETFQKIDARGGANPSYMKVKIVRYRLDGKVVEMK